MFDVFEQRGMKLGMAVGLLAWVIAHGAGWRPEHEFLPTALVLGISGLVGVVQEIVLWKKKKEKPSPVPDPESGSSG